MGMNGINGAGGIGGTSSAYGYDRFKDEAFKPGAPEEEWNGEPVEGTDEDKAGKAPGRKSSPAECETCKNRKYQDGSNEMVSFKAAGHIDPNNAAMVVMGHEQEHVSNAYRKAALGGGEVERATVRLKTDICPECGRTYISGGVTSTQIKYYNESNPYQKDMKASDAVSKYRGANVDLDQ